MIPLKCEQREGCESIKTIHTQINDILYKYSFRYIDQGLANECYTKLVELGKKLSESKVPDRAVAKKDELLSKLRPICKNLGEYRKLTLTFEDVPTMQKAINSFLHTYITKKNEGELTVETILDLLAESKRLYDVFWGYNESLKTDTLVNANSQLFSMLEKRYSINL